MTISPLVKKLRLHTASRALILNPPKGFLDSLEGLPDNLRIDIEGTGEYDYVHLFVKDFEELNASIDHALEVVKYDTLLWISYPKGSSRIKSDLNRDTLWEAMLERGIRPVTQVSVDKVWSAVRFRPIEAVGKK
jgi:hypothetical protein